MIPKVVQSAADSSPRWVQHVVGWVTPVWDNHPVTAAASAVWIQVGLGLFLLAIGRGTWSRLAGVAGAAWGLIVWVFGEAFGQVFAPGLTWMFGAPGAAALYVVAGVLIALPDSAWRRPDLGRRMLQAIGLFLVGMAVLQAWPGRGFWQGHTTGSVTAMVQSMAQTPQPRLLASAVRAFAGFDAAHGWAVNLFAVAAPAVIGLALCTGRRRFVRPAVIAAVVVGLADWLLVQDLGFMGGVGTDPNSMIPLLLLITGGYLAWTRVPAPVTETATEMAPTRVPAGAGVSSWGRRLGADPAYTLRLATAVAAVGVILVGAAPMALAATETGADPILANAISGPPTSTDTPEPQFRLGDQNGNLLSLSDLVGRAVFLTFLDPVCTTDCPVIASEMKNADSVLGADGRRVVMVAVNANPELTDRAYLQAFDRQEHLDGTANWRFLTGTPAQLQAVYRDFGVDVETGVGGSMMSHTDAAFVIDPSGRVRQIINTDPGPATAATDSSFARAFADAVESVLNR
jgi:cytochrome oxidase Cu insertion factor (SCO1/SenC/PrrC family)